MVPTAGDMPEIVMVHQHSPSPLNPLGVKGVGEGGAVAPSAAIANAIADALAPFGAEFNATPIKSEQIVTAARSGSLHSPRIMIDQRQELRWWLDRRREHRPHDPS
jgi:carbon-monoxide dehydrogenase large subunit